MQLPIRFGSVSIAAIITPLSFQMAFHSGAIDSLMHADYSPRRALYLAHPWLLWTNVLSDVLIAFSYIGFFVGIRWLIAKVRHIPELKNYLWVLNSFCIFILASGGTVLIRIVTLWWPMYQFSIALKIVCAAAATPTAIIFAVQAPAIAENLRRFFRLLANDQQQAEKLRKSEEFLDRTNHLAGVGGWEIDLRTNEVTWSEQTYRIHDAPANYQPTVADGLERFAPETRPLIEAAIRVSIVNGQAWDLELPLITFEGRHIWARTMGIPEFLNGKPIRLVGAFQDITTSVATREALRIANERVAVATESGGIGIWDWNIETGHLYCDPQMYRLHGKSPDDTSDMLWRDHLHPEDRDRVIQALEGAVEGTHVYDEEFRLVWSDGSVHYLRGAARVTRDQNGRGVRMIGINWDVSAIVETRNALRIANERVSLATDSGGIGIFDWDIKADLCTADPWMHRLWDIEHTGQPFLLEDFAVRMHPEDRPAVIEALKDAVAGLRTYNTEFRIVWKDGSIRYIRANGQVTRDESGLAIRMVGVNSDITESRRLTAELAEQHELLRVTLQSIADGVITTDAARNVAWLNPAAERMTGWPSTEAVRRPLSEVFLTFNAETRELIENPVANFPAQGKTVGVARHTVLVSRDLTEYGIENVVAPIRNNVGELLGNILVFRDVTEQRRYAAEAERVTKLQLELKTKDDFLSHVSHELRSPLTSIYSFTSIICDGLAGQITPEQNEYLQIVLKNVVQLQAMIEDLLTVTQTREGKLSIELQETSPSEAVEDALHTVQGSAATKRIALCSDHHADLPDACADPTRLRQVLIILLDNAVKFTPEGGSVTVHIEARDLGFLLFQVIDTGCGIPPEMRTRVFENLYQITGPSQSDTSQAGRTGLGLGLHIARNLVTRQGGNIWVTDGPADVHGNRGSIFNFTVPIYTGSCLANNAAANMPRRRITDFPGSPEDGLPELQPAA